MKAPKAPDPYATAQAQAQMNKETAISQAGLNAMNQYTPDGNLEYSQESTWADGTPKFRVTQTLSDSNKRLHDLGNQTEENLATIGVDQSKRMGDLLATPLSFAGLGKVPTGPNLDDPRFAMPTGDVPTFNGPDATLVDRRAIDDNQALEGRLIDLGRRRLDPAMATRRAELDASLADKGIKVGSAAYGEAMRGNAEAENDALSQLILTGQGQAFGQSRDRAQSDFSQDIARTGQFFTQGQTNAQNAFAQALAARQQLASESDTGWQRALAAFGASMQGRQQTIDEMLAERQTPINELSALMSGSQVAKPAWTATPQTQIQPADLAGLVQSNYQAKMQGYSGMLSGIGSLAGNILGFGLSRSDRRLKTDIQRLGELPNGLGVYLYRFKSGGPFQIGLMADEVAQLHPDAVHVMPDGFLAVDYAKATQEAA